MKSTSHRSFALATGLVVSALLGFSDWPVLAPLGKAVAALLALVALLWTVRVVWRRLLWRVGRRLAFSYFLVGVLPIPMLVLLIVVGGYLLSGAFLGHLYRDAASSVVGELAATAELAATRLQAGDAPAKLVASRADDPVHLAIYRQGRRVAGSELAPSSFPAWMVGAETPRTTRREPNPTFVALADGTLALATARLRGSFGVVALRSNGLDEALQAAIDARVSLFRSDDPRRKPVTFFEFGGRRVALRQLRFGSTPAERAAFYARFPPRLAGAPSWRERPWIEWVELSGAVRALDSGTEVADYAAAALVASPEALREHLLASSAEVDTTAWLLFLGLAAVLLDIYVVAAAIALTMIFGLSRAVNRLSSATEALRRGDFQNRIRVRRRDQLGELQRSFNAMAAHLEELVATAAQKEVLDKELELAQRIQQDLLPRETLKLAGVRFSTSFEPSAAIGGDYFDILRIDDTAIAVVIADVAGHGLPAGLRMAMLKAALRILVENGETPRNTLSRLGDMIRSERRTFVTATLARFEPADGRLLLINAGHPPCYRIHAGGVEEILLPSPPLGLLGQAFGERELRLGDGESMVWLSDGLIEARNAAGEPFGYERVAAALAGPATPPEAVRDRLLAAVLAFIGKEPVEDDRTVVVLSYRPEVTPKSS